VLHDQIDALESALQDLSGPLVLVGHSIGAHIALQLARRRAVHAVIGLYPFMRVNKRSRVQQVLAVSVAIRPLVELLALLAGLLSRLPSPVRHFLLSPTFSLFGLSKNARSVTSRWLRASSIRNVCVLGASEFHALQGTPDWGADCGCPVVLYYGPSDDMWAPPHDADDAAAAGVHVTRDASYGHMFCVTPEGSQHVAERTAQLVKLAAVRVSPRALETTAQ
jgi:pimeloyl-ACP methyl ester carboxylesterase